MISGHKYTENTLYLYFDYNYEFGIFNIKKSKKGYINEIKSYIKKIGYKSGKLVIMVGSIIVLTLSVDNYNISINNNLDTKESVFEIKKGILNNKIKNISITDNDVEIKEEKNTNKIQKENVDNNKKESISETRKKEKNSSKEETIKENKEISIEEIKKDNLVNLIHNGINIEIDLEDYVIGVVAVEMPASFNIEALKAQSIVARTYALNIINSGRKLTDNNSTQNYIDISEMKKKWGSDFDKYYNKIKSAVSSTRGITIKYNGKYIDAVYHSTSNGYTEDAINVWGRDIPYLKSVESSYDKNASSYLREKTFLISDFNSKLGVSISSNEDIQIVRNNTNRVEKIYIGNIEYTGIKVRELLGLRSTDFDIQIEDSIVKITTRGYGHGVGMSQYGANGMANAGYKCNEILKHYYSGVTIN